MRHTPTGSKTGSVVDLDKVEAMRRGNRSAAGPVLCGKRRSQTGRTPLPFAEELERADHGASTLMISTLREAVSMSSVFSGESDWHSVERKVVKS